MMPAKVKTLGHKFQGLTLWHMLLLHALESPIVGASDDAPQPQDLLILARVNATSYGETPRLKAGIRGTIRTWLMHLPFYLNYVMPRFSAWLAIELSVPRYFRKLEVTQEGSNTTAPRLMALALKLAKEAGTSVADAWNTRYVEALYMEGTLAEMAGASLRFDYEEEEAEDLREMTEEEALEIALKNLPPSMAKHFKAGNIEINGLIR